MMSTPDRTSNIMRHVESQYCCDPVWEAAYRRFETVDEERSKFRKRLQSLGVDRLNRQLKVVDLFCGRGTLISVLDEMGFKNIEGVDLSLSLLEQYSGPSSLHVADCRQLPQADSSVELVIVQGGLHHLPEIDVDLPIVCSEVERVLVSGGQFMIVEPWNTPFLKFVHWSLQFPAIRRLSPRADALAEMIDRERTTYEAWLHSKSILSTLRSRFKETQYRTGWGKIYWVGQK